MTAVINADKVAAARKEVQLVITENQFKELLRQKTGDCWERAVTVFRNYGSNSSFDVTNVLMHATEQNKIREVLKILEEHYDSHLKYQHPDIRGMVANMGVNPTHTMFIRICTQTLGLKPTS